ncbi:MAG: RNA polymerase sigma factor [Brumimicrobium sp.]
MEEKEDIAQKEFITKLKKGDKNSFNLLYTNYSSALYGVIYRMLQKEDAAADVMQETFVKIWKKMDSFDDKKGRLYTWMLNIARNTAIDKLRKLKREGRVEIQTFESFVSSSTVHQTSMNVDHLGVKEVVEQLDEEYKTIIDYLYFGGYTQQEVSDELDIPLGTVKTRARTAMKKLRKILTNFIFWI